MVLWLWYKRKNSVNVWFLVQGAFLALSFYYILEILKGRPEISAGMLSEENSLSIGKAGVLWAISMVSMLCGIWQLNTARHKGRKG
ncbi:MAG: hypothetical protein JM58_15505 [Peptococcaceae bacterium BICA1-8]|nr:MAG: hypothetical protein JM58_15505 [Peptococcaceae bacterium BICA1-8]